jgi:hypothetical protein
MNASRPGNHRIRATFSAGPNERGVPMRRKIALFAVTAAAAAALVAVSPNSDAATPGVDLAIKGSVVAAITSSPTDQNLPFSFTITNKSSSSSADISFDFTITNGTANGDDYVCPLIRDHYAINPDTPSCEPGALAAGKSAAAAIIATPTSAGTLTVRGCASNLSGTPDPVSSNNCATLHVNIS